MSAIAKARVCKMSRLLFLSSFLLLVMRGASTCDTHNLDFIVLDGDATLAAIEDDVVADLQKVGIKVTTRFMQKDDFNSNMTSGNFNLCFSETWGPPYDPHSYAASWKSPDEAHFAALKGMQAPMTQTELTSLTSSVLLEESTAKRHETWKHILQGVHEQAINLPISSKRIPTVLNQRLSGYMPGQSQFDYPVQYLTVLSGSKTVTIAPGAQSGLFQTVGRLDPHTYRPNEFFSNNWVYEGLVDYGANGVIKPSLATSWTIEDLSSGGQQYTFTLRQGVKFHDGAAWNCAAAKLNFDHVLVKPLTTGDWHGWYDLPKQVESWSCTGESEFVLTTKDKYYPLLQELSYIRPLRMLSPAMFASGASTNPKSENSCHAGWGSITWLGETIVCAGVKGVSGTGPFRYVETLSSGDVQFERNENHWHSKPEVETLMVKKYESHAAVKEALLDGSLDAVMGAGVVKPADLAEIRSSHASKLQVFLGPPIQNRMIVINSNKAPTDNLDLRKSIMHAVNKDHIIEKELYGLADPVDSLFPKNAPYCDVSLTPSLGFDFSKAGQLNNCPPGPTPSATPSLTPSPTPTSTENMDAAVGHCCWVISLVPMMLLILQLHL